MHDDRGQNFVEYVFLILAITTALFAMQVYVRRGIQAKLKDFLKSSRFLTSSKEENKRVKEKGSVNVVRNTRQYRSTKLLLKNGELEYVQEENTVTKEK